MGSGCRIDARLPATLTQKPSGEQAHPKDVSGHGLGAQSDVVAPVMPLVVPAAKQVFDVEIPIVRNPELAKIEIDPSSLLLRRIQVDRD